MREKESETEKGEKPTEGCGKEARGGMMGLNPYSPL